MSRQRQPGFLAVDKCAAKLTVLGDPLVKLKAENEFEAFRANLNRAHEKDRKSNARSKPIDVVLMFQVLILQHLYNLSNDGLEYPIRNRLSFMRFVGLLMEDRVPDAKTVWLFREWLKALGLVEVLFARCNEQLADRGYVAKAGQMIDAAFAETPRQRNSREANAKLKVCELPDGWDDPAQAARCRQKNTDARWTKQNDENHYGCKNHRNADAATKLIQDYAVTPANVHDSQGFDDLLETESRTPKDRPHPVYADSAYHSAAREADLAARGLASHIHEKGTRAAQVTDDQPATNRIKSTVRARVEHIFGAQAAMGGHVVRTICLERDKVKIGWLNLTYNIKRRA